MKMPNEEKNGHQMKKMYKRKETTGTNMYDTNSFGRRYENRGFVMQEYCMAETSKDLILYQ
jgi:hypothetical protein